MEDARVAVIGAGWIGSEFAASARQRGLEVTVIDPLELPYERILGPEIRLLPGRARAAWRRDAPRSRGRCVRGRRQVSVSASVGEVVECDFAVVGIGISPRTELAAGAGLEVDNGVVDERAPGDVGEETFAAGDSSTPGTRSTKERIRVEHGPTRSTRVRPPRGRCSAMTSSYERIPYFYSDQYDVGIEYSGYATSGTRSCSAATARAASSLPSGCATAWWSAA